MDELAMSAPRETSARTSLLRRVPPLGVMVRFLVTGGSVAAIHLSLVTVMVLLGVHIQVALIVSYLVSLLVHFTLNRQWVFASTAGYAFHLSLQGLRYLVVAGLSYAATAISIAILPDMLGVPELAVFVVATCAMACVSFTLLHLWVFRTGPRTA